jgi:hypothetical protein
VATWRDFIVRFCKPIIINDTIAHGVGILLYREVLQQRWREIRK